MARPEKLSRSELLVQRSVLNHAVDYHQGQVDEYTRKLTQVQTLLDAQKKVRARKGK